MFHALFKHVIWTWEVKTIVWTIIQFKQCMKHVPTYPIFFIQIICNDTKHLWTCFQLALHICCKSLRVFNFWITLQNGLCTIQWNHKNWKIGGGGRRKPISRFHRFPVVCWRLRERGAWYHHRLARSFTDFCLTFPAPSRRSAYIHFSGPLARTSAR
jgi:hypothetical protein